MACQGDGNNSISRNYARNCYRSQSLREYVNQEFSFISRHYGTLILYLGLSGISILLHINNGRHDMEQRKRFCV